MRKICAQAGLQLCAAVIAEYDQRLRRAVAAEYGYSANPCEWAHDNCGVPTIYITDVWNMFTMQGGVIAAVIKEATWFGMQNGSKYFVGGGSPCPDLSCSGATKGNLGFVGEQSIHFHVFVTVIIAIKTIDPAAVFFLLIENAGSMLPIMRDYMCAIIGIPSANRARAQPVTARARVGITF